MKLTMKDVMTANCQIPHAEMLTSNHCAALARELNAMFAAPVPPAGDVEVNVIACAVFAKNGNIRCWSSDCNAVGLKASAEEGSPIIELVDLTHITRLTAERDEEALWRKEAREGWGQPTKVIEMQRAKLDEQEAELTKARELLLHMQNYSNKYPTSPIAEYKKQIADVLGSHPTNSIAHNVDESCGQGAEAAKGGA